MAHWQESHRGQCLLLSSSYTTLLGAVIHSNTYCHSQDMNRRRHREKGNLVIIELFCVKKLRNKWEAGLRKFTPRASVSLWQKFSFSELNCLFSATWMKFQGFSTRERAPQFSDLKWKAVFLLCAVWAFLQMFFPLETDLSSKCSEWVVHL